MSGVVYAEALLHGLLRSYRRNVNFFVVPSRFYIQKFAEWGMPRTLFRHIPNFVDVERHRPQYQPGREFVYVGRLSREKGLITLIRAAAAAQQSLQIVGTGPQRQELQQLATSLRSDVQFSGYLTGESLHDAVRGARAVVLPSEWYENAPLSVLEAYALGKPVIGARIGGIPELIREQQSGQTFSSGDPEALSAALLQVASMPDADVEAMGRYGRQWMEAEFTAAHYRQRMLGLYGELGVNGAMTAAGSSI